MQPIKRVECSFERHAPAILAIMNDAIENTTAIYDYKARPQAFMEGWFKAKRDGGFPVLGLESEDGELLGFASYGSFRAWAAYKYTVEHSIYIHRDHRGKGLGAQLLGALIESAKQQELHVLIGGIDASNHASIALHQKFGFTLAGTIHQAAYKFGRWLDLAFYQLTLETPSNPREG